MDERSVVQQLDADIYLRAGYGVCIRVCVAAEQVLYQVCFAQNELWPEVQSGTGDRTCVDIFEHWLEAE